jgi:DNA-binding response OmpR family regulator
VSQCCPTCGQGLAADLELRIDPAGFVVRAGRFAALTRQEMAVLTALQDAGGRPLSKERLHSALYWQRHDDEEPDAKIVDVWVCRLRKKVAPLGIVIKTVWGQGYRLVAARRAEAA